MVTNMVTDIYFTYEIATISELGIYISNPNTTITNIMLNVSIERVHSIDSHYLY